MTEPQQQVAIVEEETVEIDVKRKFLRVTSTMHLDWPQHGVVLHSLDSGKTNDFAQPEDLPEEVALKLRGFIRSGHVKIFVATLLEGEDVPTFTDVTPTAEEMADDDEAAAEAAPPPEGEAPADPASTPDEPPAPAEPPAAEQPEPTPATEAAPPPEGEAPAT